MKQYIFMFYFYMMYHKQFLCFILLYETSKYHNSMLLIFNDFQTSVETSLVSQDDAPRFITHSCI